jgi:hypothetical protein
LAQHGRGRLVIGADRTQVVPAERKTARWCAESRANSAAASGIFRRVLDFGAFALC